MWKGLCIFSNKLEVLNEVSRMKVTMDHLDNESATYSAPQTGGYRDKECWYPMNID